MTDAATGAHDTKPAHWVDASIHAVETTPLVSAYAAAKAALLSLTRSSALEGAAKKIRSLETPIGEPTWGSLFSC